MIVGVGHDLATDTRRTTTASSFERLDFDRHQSQTIQLCQHLMLAVSAQRARLAMAAEVSSDVSKFWHDGDLEFENWDLGFEKATISGRLW